MTPLFLNIILMFLHFIVKNIHFMSSKSLENINK